MVMMNISRIVIASITMLCALTQTARSEGISFQKDAISFKAPKRVGKTVNDYIITNITGLMIGNVTIKIERSDSTYIFSPAAKISYAFYPHDLSNRFLVVAKDESKTGFMIADLIDSQISKTEKNHFEIEFKITALSKWEGITDITDSVFSNPKYFSNINEAVKAHELILKATPKDFKHSISTLKFLVRKPDLSLRPIEFFGVSLEFLKDFKRAYKSIF